jgi:hypothetical protein
MDNLPSHEKNVYLCAKEKQKNMHIANPIYDVVFKYMMEDNKVAKKLISAIIGEEIIELGFAQTERTHTQLEMNKQPLTVCHFDFRAKIKVPNGEKTVIIELQKAQLHTDIMRFRRYLGNNYSNEDNNYTDIQDKEKKKSRQIYCIFIINYNAGLINTPVLAVNQRVIDVSNGEEYTEKNEFIESLHHRSWIIQIKAIASRRRNELEEVLSIFDQDNRGSDDHVLNIKEEDFPIKYREIIRCLHKAYETPEIKEQMTLEDDILEEFRIRERIAAHDIANAVAEKDKAVALVAEKDETIAEKDETIAEQATALTEKDKALSEKDKALSEKDNVILETQKALSEQAKRIAELERRLNKQ